MRYITSLCWALLISSAAHAQTLSEAFDAALAADPTYQSATAAYIAAKESVPQAVSQMLPAIYGQASLTRVHPELYKVDHYNVRQDTLTLSQPLFNFGQWMQLSEAYSSVKQAQAKYASALQTLMVQLSKQYFGVLSAADDLRFAKAQEMAFAHHLDQAQHRFQAGLIAHVDVQQAQARHDTAAANRIVAENALSDALEHLEEMTNQSQAKPPALPLEPTKVRLAPPAPHHIEAWVDTAIKNNYALQAAQFGKEAARLDIHRARSGHWPTISIDGSIQRNNTVPANLMVPNASIGLNVKVPLFQGGAVLSQTREAQAAYSGAQASYDAILKQTISQTRRAYRGIVADISRAQALAQAVASNNTALKATQAAYEIGTRSISDVLDAQTDLLEAQNAHIKVYYDYFVQQLTLKQATGMLAPSDIMHINRWLEASTPAAP